MTKGENLFLRDLIKALMVQIEAVEDRTRTLPLGKTNRGMLGRYLNEAKVQLDGAIDVLLEEER